MNAHHAQVYTHIHRYARIPLQTHTHILRHMRTCVLTHRRMRARMSYCYCWGSIWLHEKTELPLADWTPMCGIDCLQVCAALAELTVPHFATKCIFTAAKEGANVASYSGYLKLLAVRVLMIAQRARLAEPAPLA